MDRNIEDKIAMLAFGELSEAQAAELRAQIEKNADSAQELRSYEALRSDLRRLKDVPPDQLSKERLQTAILTQGLSPKPVRRAFPWMWAATPVAMVAALAFLFIVRTSPEQQTVTPQLDSHLDMTAMLNEDDREMASSLAGFDGQALDATNDQPAPVAATAAPTAQPVAVQPAVTRHTSSRRHSSYSSQSALVLSVPSSTPTPLLPTDATAEPAKKTPESLVLIQSQSDNSTGAKNAVEVHQTADVIVSS